jgi:adenylate cyclase
MVEPVLAQQGVLDKFIGDAIMAVWGCIRTRGPAEDVRAAVTTALKMREALVKLNERWLKIGKKPLAMGIGINFGEAIVGNIGSLERMNLTVIGDAVNLASRLEGVTKEYSIDLLLGENAAVLARDFFHLQTVGLVQVKGRAELARVYTVLGERSKPLDEPTAEYLRLFEVALQLYRKREFTGALDLFAKCEALRANDPLALIYATRCETLHKHAPPADWDGVFVMKDK